MNSVKELYGVLLKDLEEATQKCEQAYSRNDYQSAAFYGGMIAHIEIMFDRLNHSELIKTA